MLLILNLLYLIFNKKISKKIFYIGIIALIIFDMWAIDKRYLNDDDFITKREKEILREIDPTGMVMGK